MRHCDVRKVARDVVVVYAARARVGSKRARALARVPVRCARSTVALGFGGAGLIRGAHKEDGGCVSGGGRYNVAPLVLPLTHLRLASRARASPNQTIAKVYREASLSDVTLCSLDPPFMRLVSARNSAKEGTYFHFV